MISRAVNRISSTVRGALGKKKGEVSATPPKPKKSAPHTKRTDVALQADTAVRPRKIVRSDTLEDVGETIPSQQNFRETFDERHTRRNEENSRSAADYSPTRFNEEDRFTNRSKDPRIGTRGRRYQP